jgi:hypothetical protein
MPEMRSMSDWRPSLPTRDELRGASRWVWVLIALAVIWIVLGLIAAVNLSVAIVYGAFVGATPALFAAALMYVAPRERLVRISAFAYALPLAVNATLGAGIMLFGRAMSSDWAYLAPRLSGTAQAFGLIGWIFPIVAVLALALYIGQVTSRTGWLIVGLGVLLALGQAAVNVGRAPEGMPTESLVTNILAQTNWIVWAYLLAVAWSHRKPLIAIAAGSHLVSGAMTFVLFNFFQDQLINDPAGLLSQIDLGVLWILGVVSWAALLAGILRELPRAAETQPTARTQEAFSAGR